MKNKSEEDISWLFLWGVTALYIAVLCMTFSGLVALNEHGKAVVTIFTDFVRDYGSLLAGIPVLIAVWVAKQQLEASRRQHIATIKRSFNKELEALEVLESYISDIINQSKMPRSKILQGIDDGTGVKLFNPRIEYIEKLSTLAPDAAIYYAKQAWYCIDRANDVSRLANMRPDEVERLLRAARSWSNMSMRHIESEQIRLSQYWS